MRARIESILHLVSDLPIPIVSADLISSYSDEVPWDKGLTPEFAQWRARLSFIGDSL